MPLVMNVFEPLSTQPSPSAGGGLDALQVAAGAGLGHRDGGDQLAAAEPGQPALLLLLGGQVAQVRRDDVVVQPEPDAAGADPDHLLVEDGVVAEVLDPAAAVLLRRGPCRAGPACRRTARRRAARCRPSPTARGRGRWSSPPSPDHGNSSCSASYREWRMPSVCRIPGAGPPEGEKGGCQLKNGSTPTRTRVVTKKPMGATREACWCRMKIHVWGIGGRKGGGRPSQEPPDCTGGWCPSPADPRPVRAADAGAEVGGQCRPAGVSSGGEVSYCGDTRPRPVLRGHPGLVHRRVRAAHGGPGGRLGRDQQRRARPGRRAHRLGQDAGRVPVVARPAGRRAAAGRREAALPGPLRLPAQGARGRRRAQPARPAGRDRPGGGPARAAAPGDPGRHPLRRHPGRRAAGLHPPAHRHPHHHARVAVPAADQRRPGGAARHRDGDRRRGARGRRHQARRAPGRLPRPARRAARPPGPADRPVGHGAAPSRRWPPTWPAGGRCRWWRRRRRRSGTSRSSSRSRT